MALTVLWWSMNMTILTAAIGWSNSKRFILAFIEGSVGNDRICNIKEKIGSLLSIKQRNTE